MSKEEDMPRRLIADELREWFDRYTMRKDVYDELTAIADRVDAEHEEALREAYTKGCEDGIGVANKADMRAEYLRGKNDGYDEGWDACFASADDWLAQHEDAMAEHGWVKLPVDADGEYIRIGDELVLQRKVWEKPYVVQGITWDGEDWNFTCDEGFFNAAGWIHYHAPTVEGLLREFVVEFNRDDSELCDEEIIERFAAKLQLRGDAE